MPLFSNVKEKISKLVNRIFQEERRSQIGEIISISDGWKPSPHRGTFKAEMDTRLEYFHGSMQKDMDEELKRRFPQTHKELQVEQVNFKVLRKKIKDKAKVFLKTGTLYLIDEKGNRVKGEDQDRFQELLKTSRFFSNCKQCDEYTQLCHRALFKPWWDDIEKRVQISIWPPQMIHVAPDPFRWWDINAAHAVLLELPGVDGLTKTNPRYEVWGYRDTEAAAATRQHTVHYTTDGESDYQANPEDVNPFALSGKPIYPFVLWRDDETTDLFRIEEDMLTINRRVNSLSTDTNNAVHYLAWPHAVHTQAEGGKPLGVKTIGPGKLTDLQYGATLEFISPDLPLGEVRQYVESMVKDDAMLDGLSSSVLRTEQAAPESGYHFKLTQKPLAEHRENNVEIYRPFVMDSALRVVIVNNTYSPDKVDLSKYRMCWEPGDLEIPENPDERANNETMKIDKNVSSPIEWRMKETGEDRQTAEASVKQNQKDNEKYIMGGQLPEKADNRFKPKAPGEPEEKEPEEKQEPGQPPAPGQAEAKPPVPKVDSEDEKKIEAAGLEVNLYQIAVAIDRGAATPADMYMAIHPEASEQEAKQAIRENIAFNNEIAAILAKAKKIEADLLGDKKKKKPEEV